MPVSNPNARHCDRCGFTEGNVRSGKMQPETLTPTIQVGKTWLLCRKCRMKLGEYKPIPRT